MGHRNPLKEFENSPGPAAYFPSINKVRHENPAYTMGNQRTPYRGID